MADEKGNGKGRSTVPGLAILGLMVTGVAGILHAFATETGIGLLAAAIAFGVVCYVSFR